MTSLLAQRAFAGELMGVVQLAGDKRQKVDSRVGPLLKQSEEIFALNLDASRLLSGSGFSLVGSLFHHRGETREFTELRFMQNYFLLVFVEGGDAHAPGKKEIGVVGRITGAENALPRRKLHNIDLPGQHAEFIVILIRRQKHTAQKFG